MQLLTQNLLLEVPTAADAPKLFEYYEKNRNFLSRWFVDQPESFYQLEELTQKIERCQQNFLDKKEVKFFIYSKGNTDELLGELNFSNIIRGGFLSCYTGYHLAERLQGKGFITEALIKGVDYMFNTMKLHRIEANIMPANTASQRVVVKAGFHREGISARYLKINGRWEDHLRYVIFNTEME